MKSYNKIMEDLDLYEELDSETQANDISNLPFSLDSWIFLCYPLWIFARGIFSFPEFFMLIIFNYILSSYLSVE